MYICLSNSAEFLIAAFLNETTILTVGMIIILLRYHWWYCRDVRLFLKKISMFLLGMLVLRLSCSNSLVLGDLFFSKASTRTRLAESLILITSYFRFLVSLTLPGMKLSCLPFRVAFSANSSQSARLSAMVMAVCGLNWNPSKWPTKLSENAYRSLV